MRRRDRRAKQTPLEKVLRWKGWIPALSAVLVLIVVIAGVSIVNGQRERQQTAGRTAVPSTPVVKPLDMSHETLLLAPGESIQLSVENAQTDAQIYWSSSDESIAAVDESGKITALITGEVVITAAERVGGARGECEVQIVEPAVLEGFTAPEGHVHGKGRQLDGVITAASAIEKVSISIYDSNDAPELEESVEWESNGPMEYDLNDEEQNLNKLVAFKKLTVGNKVMKMAVVTEKHGEIELGSWNFEVYEPVFPYKSALDPTAYPTLMPDEWDYWVKAENCNANIDPVFKGRLAALAKAHNQKLIFYSGFRTRAKQQELYNMYLNGTGNLAARPGTGWHEFGAAVDAKDWVRDVSARELAKYGLCKPVAGESWHIQPVETNSMNKKNFYNAYSSSKYPEWSKNCYITK